MKLKIVGLAALAATALTAFAASTASATTLEVNGVTQNSSVSLSGSAESGTSWTLARTDGSLANTCTTSNIEAATSSPFTGTKVTGAVSTLTLSGCSETVTVDKTGKLYVQHITGTTNGTVSSEEAEVTVKTPFGNHLNCKTGAGTDIGTLTGVSSGNATMDINAVLNCGFLLPSAIWKGSYTITSTGGSLGVSA
ncbi:MAG TPA: hypothetical protein VFZ29_11700 [Solirubrobacterales bacterium]